MKLNPDYFDMFKILNTAGVRYLVIGGYAFGFHVEPRTTKDLDIWVSTILLLMKPGKIVMRPPTLRRTSMW